MRVDILTLFPEMFSGPFDASIIKRARARGLVEINLINIRDFSRNKHRTVDDTPFGGGAGMVMAAEPIFEAMDWIGARAKPDRVILLRPAGRTFTQAVAAELSRERHLVLICGHYEGVDERVAECLATDEISIGDFVLTGGEIPAMVVVDAVSRLIPGVLGEETSVAEESFSDGLLEYPHYTRPREYRGYPVPEVLLSGHHENIRLWRRRQSLLRTLAARPDLLHPSLLTPEDRRILLSVMGELKELLQ
ncbi:tRNA (guanosine(37)-N1)-methyltransferase TrmD [Desulfofundulus thermobenzoicus]|uniref:tRNA (guanine-N(1)-)-methyltransferase n=1 Tax=Desulfofundulus thermobenzoicus TaxID=29376 RepID=A0A6N7IQ99_9FIRM|nr:tRNA (guanosine(37)-N1)-methyltransferase TrmD [Desulfofundulus thermobenzoicus]MQL52202.1 tRNA (guanosine(37)-N1)-methyltransferase TrmD [Desulfofundulus thermobenzoicus]HHW43094.1 tRNA (guanosine(37)-N1)-methyltransferase TrmD [Desulfotomaculum sp.]